MGTALAAASLFSQAAAPVMGAFGAYQQSRAMKQQENANYQIGRTRANQSDTSARTGLEADLSSYRATFSANDAGNSVANLQILNRVRDTRERDRRIETGNQNREAEGARARAGSNNPGAALAQGLLRGGPSLFEYIGSIQ